VPDSPEPPGSTVDVHAHHLPNVLEQVLRRRAPVPRIRPGSPEHVDCGSGLVYPLLDGLVDLEHHLAGMDQRGIGVRLLSAPPPGVAGLTTGDAVAVARDANDELAELPGRSGGRLRGLAVLPLQHPEQAAEEVRRTAALGLPGAQLLSNAEGRPLDGPEYHSLFEAAAECDVPLVLHPTLPIDRGAVDAHGLLTTLGFLFDTTACAARLVLSGIYDRHPDLILLLPHAGSTIPYLLGRFDYELELMGVDHGLSGRPSEHLRRLYLDSVCESPLALRLAVAAYGASRITFGSDEPFWSTERAEATIAAAGLADEDVEQIRYRAAARLFRLR
jgi:predicted TIM-barrel fold metal-dependent hydrolase